MVKFILSFLILGASTYGHSSSSWQRCHNEASQDSVELGYIDCLNSNFSLIEQSLGLELFTCHSIGGSHNSQFLQCLNGNLKRVSIQLGAGIPRCYNWNGGRSPFPNKISLIFQDCMNQSIKDIFSFFEGRN